MRPVRNKYPSSERRAVTRRLGRCRASVGGTRPPRSRSPSPRTGSRQVGATRLLAGGQESRGQLGVLAHHLCGQSPLDHQIAAVVLDTSSAAALGPSHLGFGATPNCRRYSSNGVTAGADSQRRYPSRRRVRTNSSTLAGVNPPTGTSLSAIQSLRWARIRRFRSITFRVALGGQPLGGTRSRSAPAGPSSGPDISRSSLPPSPGRSRFGKLGRFPPIMRLLSERQSPAPCDTAQPKLTLAT